MCVGALIGGIMVSFPTITGFNIFMFTSHFYCFSILLATLAVLFLKGNIKNKLIGIVFTILSLAIYQAIFPYLVCLYVMSLIFGFYSEESLEFKEELKNIFGILISLLLSVGLYLVSIKIGLALLHVEMTQHRGAGSAQLFDNLSLKNVITNLFIPFNKMLTENYCGISGNKYISGGIFIVYLVIVVLILKQVIYFCKKTMIKEALLVTVLFVCYLVALNLICLLNSDVYSLMVYSIVTIFIFSVIYLFDINKGAITLIVKYVVSKTLYFLLL